MPVGAVVGGFLGKYGMYLLGGAIITAGGWYIFHVMQENGRLESELSTEQERVAAWEDRFDQLQKDRQAIAKWDDWLEEQRAITVAQNREYSRKLEELRNEVVGLKDYLDMQPPPDFREFLCNSGLVQQELCEGDSGQIPE